MTRGGRYLDGGALLGGYRIDLVLGRGGRGVVYLATDVQRDRRVALKVISADPGDDEELCARVVSGSKLAASLQHPNILPVYAAGQEDGMIFIAMQYVEEGDLRRQLREQGSLSAARAVAIARQVALALDVAHTAGLIHGDLTPSNILLGANDHAYVADFGFSRDSSSGWGDYASPEQIEGKPIDGRADIYSLGCVLFHCLAGHPAFVRDSDIAVAEAHTRHSPPRLDIGLPDLPVALSDAVCRSMEKTPGDRYPRAADFAAAIATLTALLPASGAATLARPCQALTPDSIANASENGDEPAAGVTVSRATPLITSVPLLSPPAESDSSSQESEGVEPDIELTRRRVALVPMPDRRAASLERTVAEPASLVETRTGAWPAASKRVRAVALLALGLALAVALALILGGHGKGHPKAGSAARAGPPGPTAPASAHRRPPGWIASVTATDRSAGKGLGHAVRLTFTVPAANGAAVRRVEWRSDRRRSGSIALDSMKLGTHTAVTIRGLEAGVAYTFRLRACSRVGCGAWSRPSNSVSPFGRPMAPRAAAVASDTEIRFSWSGGGHAGRPIAAYEISIDGAHWRRVGRKPGSELRAYRYSETHSIRVRVRDSAGQTSPPSGPASAKTAPPPPTPTAPAPRYTPTPPPTQTVVNQ